MPLPPAVALDTSSIEKFDLAFDCEPVETCPLNDVLTANYLQRLDADFDATVPEAETWTMTLVGFAGVGVVSRARRRWPKPAILE